jgi:protoheme IX farnesyltransferase
LFPARFGLAGDVYFTGAVALGIGWTVVAVIWALRPTAAAAKTMFRASIVYLPSLMLLMVLDRA